MKPHPNDTLAHFIFDRYLLLPLGALIAMVWANVAAESYFTLSHRLSFLVNEIGMALFLGLVMQEVMDATLPGGALHTWRRWMLPLIAAAGGVLGSALTYVTFVQLKYETVLTQGWPIATAVDIAAAYFLLKLIFRRGSPAYPFLLLMAVVSNAFALTVVGLPHYAYRTQPGAAALLLAAVGLAALLHARRVRAFWPYLTICGPLSWAAFYLDGLHPALALLPIVPFLPHRPRGIALLENGVPSRDHTRRIEHEWAYVVQPIVFLFGLVNAGVSLTAYDTGTWAQLSGALLGRPLGIVAAVWLATLAGLHLPRQLGWRDLVVTAAATSSGFTFALFAATAVFPIGPLLGQAKLGALLTAAGALSALALARVLHVGRFAGDARTAHPVRRAAPLRPIGIVAWLMVLGTSAS